MILIIRLLASSTPYLAKLEPMSPITATTIPSFLTNPSLLLMSRLPQGMWLLQVTS
jgi:hypothetical protein